MPIPRRLLDEDETVLVDARPHWIRLVFPVTVAIFVFAACVTGFVAWRTAPSWFGAILAASIGMTGCFVGARIIVWRAANLIVTTDRVLYRSGVVRRVGREIPISSVRDVSYHQGIFERILGAGTISIESTGGAGIGPIHDIRNPAEVQTLLNRAVRQAQGSRQAQEHFPVPRGRDAVMVQIEQLADLRLRGIITEAEFAGKKAELLNRIS